ncbi:hypothetical protein [Ferruginibacter profundus]
MPKKATEGKDLTTAEKNKLLQYLNTFATWLLEKGIIKELPALKRTIDLPDTNEDWVMRFNPRDQSVSFNTHLRKRCSFDYYMSIVIHEFFHLAVQKVPNKEDAVKIKDDFGDEWMKIIDIEADFFTAVFYKEKLNFTLVQFLELFYQSGQIFGDKWIRKGKLERYIGTLLTVCKMFLTHPNKTPLVTTYDLYLPSIGALYTEENLHVIVLRKEHIYFEQIDVTFKDVTPIMKCYTNVDSLTLKGYVEFIVTFTSKALSLKIPLKTETEIGNLKN